MSAGHRQPAKLSSGELDDLLDEALSNKRVQSLLHRPYRVDTNHDIPLLGSSAIGWRVVYFDRRVPVGALPLDDGRKISVRAELIRHERLEAILENVFGWPYGSIAHPVAEHWEERGYADRGLDPKQVEKAFAPFIRFTEREALTKVPTDLDLRPSLKDEKLLARTKVAQEKGKVGQANVKYVDRSEQTNQTCAACVMFVKAEYGGPGCTLVKSPIHPAGWCKRFSRGRLDGLPPS